VRSSFLFHENHRRHKDLARIEQLMSHAKIDKAFLDDILLRYNLKLLKK